MPAPQEPTRAPWKPLAIAAAVAALPFALLVWRFDFVCDDAYISFRYAKNLAAGLGLRFNPGTEQPVEGYSNLLWVLVFAVVELLQQDPAIWSRVLTVPSGFALGLVATRLAQKELRLDALGTTATALFFFTLPTVFVWSTSGLASMPSALFAFLVYERLLGDDARPRALQAGLCAAVTALLRVDGFAFVAMPLTLALVTGLLTKRRALVRAAVVAGALCALAIGGQIAFRLAYHGDWLPNTVRVKVVGADDPEVVWMRRERGLLYVAWNHLTVLSYALVPLAALAFARVRDRRLMLHALAVVAGTSTFAALAGGDFMAFARLLLPAMPYLALAFAVAFVGLRERGGPPVLAGGFAAAAIALSLLPAYDVHLVPRPLLERAHFRWSERDDGRQTEYERWARMRRRVATLQREGIVLKRLAAPGDSYIAGGIGAVGYFSDLHVFDAYCLTNDYWKLLDIPVRRASPGHDVEILRDQFLRWKPTFYSGIFLHRDEPPNRGLPNWKENPIARMTVVEHHPLRPHERAFPEEEFRLVRFLRWR